MANYIVYTNSYFTDKNQAMYVENFEVYSKVNISKHFEVEGQYHVCMYMHTFTECYISAHIHVTHLQSRFLTFVVHNHP